MYKDTGTNYGGTRRNVLFSILEYLFITKS